jgi:hypothetical protein
MTIIRNILLYSDTQMTCGAFEFLFMFIARRNSILFGAVGDVRDGSHTLSLGAPIPRQGYSQPESNIICS